MKKLFLVVMVGVQLTLVPVRRAEAAVGGGMLLFGGGGLPVLVTGGVLTGVGLLGVAAALRSGAAALHQIEMIRALTDVPRSARSG